MNFVPGQLIGGRFRLINPIARGAFGDLFRAADRVPERQVAIRFVGANATQTARDHFLYEMRAARALRDRCVATIVDSGRTDNGTLWYASELLLAEPLDELLERRGQILPGAALSLIADLSRATAAAHALGIVHRAIEPRAVLLHRTPFGSIEPKLVDFGRRTLLASREPTTTYYDSPELLSGDRHPGPETDVYSLGILLFRLITGRVPFSATTTVGRLAETYNVDRLVAEAGLDEEVCELILSCVEPAKARRISAHVLADRAQLLCWLAPGGFRDLEKMVRITNAMWLDPAATGAIDHFETIPGPPGAPEVVEEELVEDVTCHAHEEPTATEQPAEPTVAEVEKESEPDLPVCLPMPLIIETTYDAPEYLSPTPDEPFIDFRPPRMPRWAVGLIGAACAAIIGAAIGAARKPVRHARMAQRPVATTTSVTTIPPVVIEVAAPAHKPAVQTFETKTAAPTTVALKAPRRQPIVAAATAQPTPAAPVAPIAATAGIPLWDPPVPTAPTAPKANDNPYD